MIVTASSMVSLLQSTTLLYTSRGPWWCVLEEKRLVPLHSRQAGRVLLLEHARVIPPSCTIQSTKVFFFLFHRRWWAKGDADSIRHSGLWIAPILYDIIGRQNVYPSSNQPFLSPRSVVYIDTPIKLRICLGAIIHADWLWLPVVSYPICTAVCCLLCPIETFGHSLYTLKLRERDVMLRYSFNTKGRVRNRQVI
jgi:hypothetical protein